MTTNPTDLLDIRAYCQQQTGQSPAALGIAGDDQHAASGGYHIGGNTVPDSDYSRAESPRDRAITTASASAFDLGGEFDRFQEITLGIVGACKRQDFRTRDIREVIYTPDGVTVRRWDRLGIRSGGDDSHLFHTHISFFRDSEGRRSAADNFLGLLRELFEGGDTMSARSDEILSRWADGFPTLADGKTPLTPVQWRIRDEKWQAQITASLAASAVREQASMVAIDALAKAIQAGGGSVDVAAIKAEILDAETRVKADVDSHFQRLADAQQAAANALNAP